MYATMPPEMYRKTPCATLLDLHEREVLLPPDVLSMHADKVVGVHHGVDKSVQHDGQVDVTVVPRVNIQPIELRVKHRGTTWGGAAIIKSKIHVLFHRK